MNLKPVIKVGLKSKCLCITRIFICMNLQEQISRIQSMMNITKENLDWDYVTKIVCKEHPDEIHQYLIEMFPNAKEVIDYNYNDELGLPFAEWRRQIYEIEDRILIGPEWIEPELINLEESDFKDREKKYHDYISAKEKDEKVNYFRTDDTDPRDIDFEKLPPITLLKKGRFYEPIDGAHRIFLAKMQHKSIRAFIWLKERNNHPNVQKIKNLF